MAEAWKLVRRIAIVVGVLLTITVFAELLDVFLSLHRVSPVLGWLFAASGFGAIVGGAVYLAWTLRSRPVVLTPPASEPEETASPADLQRHAKYLGRYLLNLSENERLSISQQQEAKSASRTLRLSRNFWFRPSMPMTLSRRLRVSSRHSERKERKCRV